MSKGWITAWGLGSVGFGGASLIVPLYLVDLGGDPVMLGVLAAVAAFVGVPGALIFGRIADKTGKRRSLVLSMLGLLAAMLLVIPATRSTGFVIVANGVIWFAFAASTPVVTLLAVADVAESEWSKQIAILNKYQGVGWAVGLLLGAIWTGAGAQFLTPETVLTSFFYVIAGCSIGGLIIGLRYFPPDSAVDTPASGTRIRRALRRADRFSVRAATFPFTPGRTDFRGLDIRRFVHRFTPNLALYFGGVFVFFAGFSAFFAPLPIFLSETGFSSNDIFLLYLINSLGAAVFFGAAGKLSARYDVTLVQAAGLLGRGVAIPSVALIGAAFGISTAGFWTVGAMFGLIGITWAVIAVTAGTLVTQLAPVTIRGEALGVYAALGALAGGVGSIIGGWLAATSYLLAFATAGGLVVAGAVVVFELRRRLAASNPPVATDNQSSVGSR
jgi:MFS family permease